MEQNNFEKKVQQQLDELKIFPSDLVWTNIEKRIDKKHKDRKVIFILFFLFLFLLSGGYWLFNSSKNDQDIQPVNGIIKNSSQPTDQRDSSLDKAVASSSNSRKHDTASVTGRRPKASVTLPSTILQNKSGDYRINRKQRKIVGKTTLQPKDRMENFFENKSTGNKQPNNEENKIALNKPHVSEIESKNEIADATNDHQNKLYSDSLSDQLKPEKVPAAIVEKDDSVTTRHSMNEQRRHWTFGITLSGGKSLLGNGLMDMDNNNNYYSVSDPNLNQGNPSPGSGGSNGSYALPSAINNSIAFIGGAFIEKNISEKNKISLGISYKYFSLVNKVGSRSSTALDQYNAINTVNPHRNNFHYLELPVSIKFQLNNSKALPLYWQAGINISQLIRSNALQFQSNPGLYYKDNSLFNKTQFGLSTGISAVLFSKQKVPLTIGPYFYYSASKLAGKGLYQNKHFNFIGIQAELLFPKK